MASIRFFTLLSAALLCITSADHAAADSFGSGANTFDIEFVDIGNPGNVADTTGNPNPAGSVAEAYRIGKYEISEQMIDKANALGLLGITKDTRGPDKPATSVSWNAAARFVNWLNLDANSTPAYKFGGDFIQLWNPGDAGYNPSNRYRNSQAKYFLPSVDEWYKAAYFDPTGGVYYDYPTGSNSIPDGIDFPGDPNFDAVFFDGDSNPQPNDITNVGVLSPYGTAGQGGNVYEWEETDFDLTNDSSNSPRGSRGGFWGVFSTGLSSSTRLSEGPSGVSVGRGFRVASIPEPASTGDFDNDGDVDGRDFLVWQRNPTIGTLADWQADYGTGMLNSIMVVPEPSTVLLGALASAGMLLRRRR